MCFTCGVSSSGFCAYGHLEGWFRSWDRDSTCCAGSGRSSVEVWYTIALDIEEVLSGAVEVDFCMFVNSFYTVDRGVLDQVLSSLGLPAGFRHVYFEHHVGVRLKFKLAAGLGKPWTRDGSIPQGCFLHMMLIVALYVPLCRHLHG